ncbi:hypothetical protein HMPREF1326_00985 [Akkermansia sp. KLE1605]|nr:hypothetical protein HMPREF1326_00985 [Akkermansia sp. KLE1605]
MQAMRVFVCRLFTIPACAEILFMTGKRDIPRAFYSHETVFGKY